MRLLQITSFRAALAFTCGLLLALSLVLGLVYREVSQQLTAMQDARIWREAASLSRLYEQDGVRATAAAVTAGAQSGQDLVLRLSDGLGVALAGNLDAFPDTETDADGWLSFETGDADPVRARLLPLDDDLVLLVGYRQSDVLAVQRAMATAFAAALLVLVLAGLSGGGWLARRQLEKVASINLALQPVMNGALETRLPTQGGDEWAMLADHINALLARLTDMMAEARQLTDGLAHDLRGPLTRLKARLEQMQADADAAAQADYVAALADIDGLLKTFAALLTLSRLDSGAAQLDPRPVDTDALLADLHDLYAPVFEEAGMQLTAQTGVGLHVSGDAALLMQACINLLENVLRHAAVAGSMVRLSAFELDGQAALSVIDAGPGIAAEQRPAAQKRFVQLQPERGREGAGLGLALVAAIARHHGGSLQLADAGPGLAATLVLPKGR